MPRCTRCQQDKDETEFYQQRNRDGSYRRYWACKKCFAEYRKERGPKKQLHVV